MKQIYNIRLVRIFAAIFLLFSLFSIYYYFWLNIDKTKQVKHKAYLKKNNNNLKKLRDRSYFKQEHSVIVPERIVHLDLKGAPPKIEYYSKLFPLLAQLGATGVLIEYEDMFPYNGTILNNLSALNAYSLEDVKTINSVAKDNNLKVIPLIQTFGHLEFLLKLDQYKDYREVWNYPSVICPSYDKTMTLVKEMIDQMLRAHPSIEMIHIGCDEVYHLGSCQRCTNRMLNDHLTKNRLFLKHISSIMTYIHQKHSNLRILAWDDHFRTMNEVDIKDVKLTQNFEPVVWHYTKDVYDELGPSLWNMYSKVFGNLWGASAFKGAIGSNKYISDVNHYVQNHKSWLSIISEHGQKITFKGVILTGWSRYDHFAVLCELFPIGIPALAMSLRLLQGFKDSALGPPLEVAKILQCSQPYGLIGSAFGSPKCKFSGGDILENVIRLHQLKQEFDEILEDSRVKGWLNDYNIAHTFSNPRYVKSVLQPLSKIKGELEFIKKDIATAMSEVYDKFTVDEWAETYVRPFEKQVLSLWEAKQKLLSVETWQRRPLEMESEL